MNANQVKTTDQRNKILADLSNFEKNTYKQKQGDWQQTITPLTHSLLTEDHKKLTQTKIDTLKTELSKLSTVEVTLASIPTPDQIDLIISWARRVLDEQIILDIAINPTMIGGIQISWQGIFYDGSISKVLDA